MPKSPCRAGVVPYDRTRTADGVTYSIDRFAVDFRFPMTDDLSFERFALSLRALAVQTGGEHFTAHRFAILKDVWQFPHFHVELWREPVGASLPVFRRDDEGELQQTSAAKVLAGENTVLRLDFNPNKCKDSEPLKRVLNGLQSVSVCSWTIKRVDYAMDVPGLLERFYVLSRKTENFYCRTRYYGVRGSNGMLRVYDKRQELKDTEKITIEDEITRFEWVQIGNEDLSFTFDSICDFLPDNYDGYVMKLLRYVMPEQINHALGSLDRDTRRKIKDMCFKPLTVHQEFFHELLQEYLSAWGFPPDLRQLTMDQTLNNITHFVQSE